MINNVTLVGRLTKDPELKYTPSNVAVATFTLAVNRNFKGANGEREADFINCMMWRKQAELFAEWCKKGNLVGVTGRIQTRNYENQEGQMVLSDLKSVMIQLTVRTLRNKCQAMPLKKMIFRFSGR